LGLCYKEMIIQHPIWAHPRRYTAGTGLSGVPLSLHSLRERVAPPGPCAPPIPCAVGGRYIFVCFFQRKLFNN
jgi:hypothetical protein